MESKREGEAGREEGRKEGERDLRLEGEAPFESNCFELTEHRDPFLRKPRAQRQRMSAHAREAS